MRTCNKCGEDKALEYYHVRKGLRDDRVSTCRVCTNKRKRKMDSRTPQQRRNRHLRDKYGITQADFDRMLEEQGNACAICNSSYPGHTGKFNVDHCHDTGKVRGLLCWDCNAAIGKLGDNAEGVQRALDYLMK